MKNIKRLLGLILAMVLLIGCLPLSAYAVETASGTCGGDLTWTLDEEGMLTISGSGQMDNFEYLCAPWNDYKMDILSIVIQDGVTTIGDSAFVFCRNLTAVSLPNSITRLGTMAFLGCYNIESIILPVSISSIGEEAFQSCWSLNNIIIPDGNII